jgi:hypothetical protein
MATAQLNEELAIAAREGDTMEVRALLEKGADVNYRGEDLRTPLMEAAYNGRRRISEILLDAGADRTLRDAYGATAAEDARAEGHAEVAKFIENYVRPKRDIMREKADEIIICRPLSDRILEEIFNFSAMERISLVRDGRNGPVEAITRESFAEVADQSALRKAFEEHVRRGGTADEAAVFPNALPKRFILDK